MEPSTLLFAMRSSIGAILIVVAVGLVVGGVFRVLADATTWFKDQMMDPYKELRKEAREKRRAKTRCEDVAGTNRVAYDDTSSDIE